MNISWLVLKKCKNFIFTVTDRLLSFLFPDYQLLQKLHFISASHQYMHWPSRRPAVCPGCGKFFKFKYNMKIHLKKCVAVQSPMVGGSIGVAGGPDDLPSGIHHSHPPPPPHAPPHPHHSSSSTSSWLTEARQELEPQLGHPHSLRSGVVNGNPHAIFATGSPPPPSSVSPISPSSSTTPPVPSELNHPFRTTPIKSPPSISIEETIPEFVSGMEGNALTGAGRMGSAVRRPATAGERKWFPV